MVALGWHDLHDKVGSSIIVAEPAVKGSGRRRRVGVKRFSRRKAKCSCLLESNNHSMLCCGRRKDQGRDIPPNAEPAASPRRLQLGQIASTLQPSGVASGRPGQPGGTAASKEFPHMVLQPDFRKVSGISTEIFRQLESVENDHDATTAAALGAVERRGEMLVRMLDPRQFSRPAQDNVRKLLSMQDALHSVHFVEIVKRPGQTLGLYIREGNGLDRYDGVFISRIAIESAVFNSGCLGVGDEILAVNLVDVTHMSLDDVVILMSIPRRLVLTIRQRKGQRVMGGGTGSILRQESKHPPVVVMKKELAVDGEDDSNGENGHLPSGMRAHHPGFYHQQQQHVNHYANLPGHLQSLGRSSRTSTLTTMGPGGGGSSVPRLFSAPPGIRQPESHSIHSLPRHASYQASYANLQLQQHYPDVTEYARTSVSRHEDFRLETPQPPIRRPQFPDLYDPLRVDGPPSRPSSQQGGYLGGPASSSGLYGPFSTGSYDWQRSGMERTPGGSMLRGGEQHHQQQDSMHHSSHHGHHYAEPGREALTSTASISYQPPPPVITEQPRSLGPAHFQPFDRAYPKTLESLAEKVHTFYTGPRPVRHHGPAHSRNSLRMPRTGSDHRLSISSTGALRDPSHPWYGSMPRQRRGSGDYRSMSLQQPLTPQHHSQGSGSLSGRYSSGARLGVPGRRKPVLDYASDSEAMSYTPTSTRSSAGISLSASTRRSLGLTNGGGRSNSLPRDLMRGRGGRKPNVRFDRRGVVPDMSSGMSARRALLHSAGIHSEDESDGAASAPEMPPRRDRGRMPSSPGVFTSAEYRAWLTRAPSTSAIYERLKTNRDSELLQTQQAAKFTFSAENLSLLDRARNRTERYNKILTDSNFDREAQSNLSLWEARLKTQEQPYYSYRSHLLNTGLTGGDSTLARALAGRSPSTSSALASLGIGQSPLRELSKESMMMSPSSSDPLRRHLAGLTPSRSRDLISSFNTAGVVSSTSTGITIDPTGGRTTPTSALLQRISEKETDSILRKELLARSLMGGRGVGSSAGESLLGRDTLKEDLEGKAEKMASRLGGISSGLSSSASPLSRSGVSSSLHHPSSVGGGGGGGAGGIGLSSVSTSAGPPGGSSSLVGTGINDSRSKLLTINPSEFVRYKIERPSSAGSDSGVGPNGGGGTGPAIGGTNGILTSGGPPHGHSGILRVHLMAGRALRSTVRSTDSTVRSRDLYCVLECDRVHKARTVVCTGDQNFDWDEVFELDIVNNKELDFLIYSWDPQLRHRLCYKGSVNLGQVLGDKSSVLSATATHQLAIKVEPRGTLYVKLKHTPPEEAFSRDEKIGLFGGQVANIVLGENSGLNVPLIVQRCIEEIERRGLDIIGLYRLCGSASKKQTLREAFERNPRIVDLSAENVPDINVIAGVLKDYLRELPEPLLTKCLYQMLIDALGVCLPDDPEGNARLLFSIIECLPKPNRCTLLLILEHLSLVCSLSDRNKMGPIQLAGSFGPILMLHFDGSAESLEFPPTIKVLQYLLEVWPAKSVHLLQTVRAAGAEAVRKGPSLLGKGRPFPRSSPASVLSPRSQKTLPSTTSLHLSQSKQSPGSLSESSPSPTSIHSSASGGMGQVGASKLSSSSQSNILSSSGPGYHPPGGSSSLTTASAPVTSSSALTLTPSTTSSSLTSVTTPNSLTPVSSHTKSIAPATTSSNYSLTSEFSTTSVTSPTPGATFLSGLKSSDTNEELFATVSVRSRVTSYEVTQPASTTAVGGHEDGNDLSSALDDVVNIHTNATISSSISYQTSHSSIEDHDSNSGSASIYAQEQMEQSMMSTSEYSSEPGYRSESSRSEFSVQQTSGQKPPVPPSPFVGRKFNSAGGSGPGRAERASSLDETGGASKRKLPPLPPSFAHPDLPQQQPQPLQPQQSQQIQQESNPNTDQYFPQGRPLPQTFNNYNDTQHGPAAPPPNTSIYSSSSGTDSGYSDSLSQYMRSSVSRTDSGSSGGEDFSYSSSMNYGRTMSSGNGQPPPPPPKPSSVTRIVARREKEVIEATPVHSGSRPGSQSEEDSSTPNDSRRSSMSDAQSVIRAQTNGGNNSGIGQASSHANGNNFGSASWSSSLTSSSTSTPTTVQSQGSSNSKGSSPGPATPGSTPPPVPPRLDRRPSQTSPTSSPPSMPPPVPPRLGRAAPVRTPSLDGREAFEVDCYTIKEENGEEDYLT